MTLYQPAVSKCTALKTCGPFVVIDVPIFTHTCSQKQKHKTEKGANANNLFSAHLVMHIFLFFLWSYKCTVVLFKHHTDPTKEMARKRKVCLFSNKLSLHLNINLSHGFLHGSSSTLAELQPCLLILGLTEIVNGDPSPTLSLFSYSVFPS